MSHTKVQKINLLPGASRLQVKAIRYRKHNKIVSVGILVVWIGVTVSVFAYSFFVSFRLKQVEADLQVANNGYAKYKDVVLATGKLRYSAKQVGEVLANRFEYAEAFENFSKLYDPNVFVIDTFELKNKKDFVVSGVIPTFLGQNALEKLVGDINDKKVDGFVSAEVTSISWSKNSGWKFAMEVSM